VIRSLFRWLAYVADEVSDRWLRGAIIVVLALGPLGYFFAGDYARRFFLAIFSTILAAGAILVLYIARLKNRQQMGTYRNLLLRYVQVLSNQSTRSYTVQEWDQDVRIHPNGDAYELVRTAVISERDELAFLRFTFGAGWNQPEKARRRVQVLVRSVIFEGVRSARWDTTTAWLSSGKLELIAHLNSPVPRGVELTLEIEIHWPGKSLPLVQGHADEFKVNFGTPIKYLTYSIALPPKTQAYLDPIGFTNGQDNFALTTTQQEERQIIKLTATDVPAKQAVGMRLELKG